MDDWCIVRTLPTPTPFKREGKTWRMYLALCVFLKSYRLIGLK